MLPGGRYHMFTLSEEEQRGRDYESIHWMPTDEERATVRVGAGSSTIEPLTTEEIEHIRQDHETYGIMVVDVPRVLATIDARDKTIAERDAEVARLQEKIALVDAYVSAHRAYLKLLDTPARLRVSAQTIEGRRANLAIVRAQAEAQAAMLAAFP